jgi:ABC-type multidrug transport system fused ATPase/permease subunit
MTFRDAFETSMSFLCDYIHMFLGSLTSVNSYLQTIFPLAFCLLSLSYLSIQIFRAYRLSSKQHKYKPLLQADHNVNGQYGTINGNFRDSEETDDDTEEEEYVTIHRTLTTESVVVQNQPKGELLLVIVEETAVLAQLAIHVVALAYNAWGSKGNTAAISQIAVWAYVAFLTTLRLFFSSHPRLSFSRLWYHTAFLYCTLWIVAALIFRSDIIHPLNAISRDLSIANFTLTTLLAIVALNSRKGNRSVNLEYEGGLEPSKEQTASVLSLASFSWVDGIVVGGYRKTLEIKDVWNLPPRDKAASLLADYRQIKKTSILAWHLMKYFKRNLIIQAAWACLSGFLTFAPTLLLKAILEYVENPSRIPKNTAWFYVILLFVSGCISAVAAGQALWIGRKVCIRLRAIIIGEVYAKSLKRKVAASSTKILLEEKPGRYRSGWIRRIFCMGDEEDDEANNVSKDNDEVDDSQVASGTIINLMAVDSFKVSEVCAYLHFLWASTPVQFIGTIFLLYQVLGASSFVGIAMMAILLPVNMVIAKKFASMQKEILAATDARIHITNEVLSNIRIIKFFAWEQRFMAQVDEKRSVELKVIRDRYIVWAFAATIWSGAPLLITFLSFMMYTRFEKKDLVPSIAFTSLSLFMILRIPLDQLADMVAHVQESKVSVDRVEEYLSEPETDKPNQLKHMKYDENGDPFIGFEDATFSWGAKGQADSEAFQLQDIDVRFLPDQFNVIVGPTGSGKTSMLMALLGEMTLLEGRGYLPGAKSREDLRPDPVTGLTESIAYCAQQAWLVNASIKDNIVFASPWDPQRYNDVIAACSLKRDLEIFDAGDQTLVGEKGVTLSGGQKQRISLARALYSRARHVLLDDVLSAVDSHTGKWIFEEAILGHLMNNRTCILVTHSVSLALPHSDYAVVLENGRIVAQGTAQEVIRSGKLADELSQSVPMSKVPSRIASRAPSINGDELTEVVTNKTINGQVNGVHSATGDQVESKSEGKVELRIMLVYFMAMGGWFYWITASLIFVAGQLIAVSTNIWIREWANAYARKSQSIEFYTTVHPISSVPGFGSIFNFFTGGVSRWSPFFVGNGSSSILSSDGKVDDWYYLSIYAAIGGVLMLSVFFREAVLFWGSITASRRIHRSLLKHVMRAKFRFFDLTPLGQIMNRFSKDIEAVDQEVTPSAVGLIYCILSVATVVILVSIITPGFLIAATFISILYFFIGMFYINSSRDLKRLESVHRSPLYQQFGETLSGMTTIRAYADERRFIRENLARINTQNRPFIFLWAANRWLAFRVDIVGAMVSFFSGTFVLLSVGRIDPGAAGLAMTYAITYTENILWLVRLYASNEQNMNSVERIKEYLDVDQEALDVVEGNRPPANWPAKGAIEFIAYSTRYRADFDLVLKKITFKVQPGEKVGVVGRTGAGKSSMALALFRALEAEEGKILVDDVDIGLIGLRDLRENVVIVPQDPTLFSGTIRSNLDPFDLFTDEEIFNALRRVQLVGSPGQSSSNSPSRPSTAHGQNMSKSVSGPDTQLSDSTAMTASSLTEVGEPEYTTPIIGQSEYTVRENKNIFLNLSSPIAESGSNLSQGQRQLLCLARAMLKAPAVLLMDEATASIDHATDAKIQETIRQLQNTTITIAHRLKTIVDYDKVLVLEQGEVIEFGEPLELMEKEGGFFRGMCEKSGEGDILKDLAIKAHKGKTQK